MKAFAQFIALFMVFLITSASPAFAWGAKGHQIVAGIAELNLSKNAAKVASTLLPDTDFSNSKSISDEPLATFADFVRHNSHFPQYSASPPWHFVDIPVVPKTEYDPKKHCKNGQCALAKIEEFKMVLAQGSLPKERRQEALVFLVHLVGDLHQPLHCATRDDRGGNSLKVTYMGHGGNQLNLHTVWDDNLVFEVMGKKTLPLKAAGTLNETITDAQKIEWGKTKTKTWMMESNELARTKAYKDSNGNDLPTAGEPDLDAKYVATNKTVVADQLKKAGIRLAKVLNDAFDSPAP